MTATVPVELLPKRRGLHRLNRHQISTSFPFGFIKRAIERQTEGRTDAEAEVIQGYCSAVRSALTDDGRPPLEPSGLKLHERLSAIGKSLDLVEKNKGLPTELQQLKRAIEKGLQTTSKLWPPIYLLGICLGASGRAFLGVGEHGGVRDPREVRRIVRGHASAS